MTPLKSIFKILIPVIALLFFSCSPKQMITELPFSKAPGEELFKKAEKQFQDRAYDTAREYFSDYLNLYPDSPLAPVALLRIGVIYSAQNQYDKARELYNLLIAKYPDSPYAQDAKVEILVTLFHQKAFDEVILKSKEIQDNKVSLTTLIRKYGILGDAYLAKEDLQAAIDAYIRIYYESPKNERDTALNKLQKVVDAFSFEEVEAILEKTEDKDLRRFFMYHLGLKYADDERYEKAINVLTSFIDAFPDYPELNQLVMLINDLKEKSEYERFTIGCMLPLSGKYKAFGEGALKGIELAMTQFSAMNPASPVQIIIRDTEADPEKAAEAVMDFSDSRVAAIIGPILTAEAAAEEAQARKIPIITLTQREHIVDMGDYVFRHFLTPEVQIKTILEYAMEELGLSRFAILYPDEKYGITFMNLMWDEVTSYGGELVGVESYKADQSDFTEAIKKLAGLYYEVPDELKDIVNETFSEISEDHEKSEEPKAIVDFDALFIPDGPEKVGLILPALVYFDVTDIILLGTNLWHSDKLIKMAGEHAQNAIMTEIFFAESQKPKVREFVSLYEETYSEKPGFIEAVSYDTAMILFQTINKSDIHFRSSIKRELLNLRDYEGVTGLTEFDESGEALKKLFLLQISGDDFIELEH